MSDKIITLNADPEYLDARVYMPFGAYGHMTDKYGFHWTFQGEKQV